MQQFIVVYFCRLQCAQLFIFTKFTICVKKSRAIMCARLARATKHYSGMQCVFQITATNKNMSLSLIPVSFLSFSPFLASFKHTLFACCFYSRYTMRYGVVCMMYMNILYTFGKRLVSRPAPKTKPHSQSYTS